MAQREVTLRVIIDKSGAVKSISELDKAFEDVETSANKAAGAAGNAGKEVEQSMTSIHQSAGLAGATLTAFSQGLSDLPFGLRGVANNISQLATLFTTLTVQTGGFGNALRALGAAFRGPLGIITVFQAALAGLQMWNNRTDKAKEKTETLAETISHEATEVTLLIDALRSESVTLQQKNAIIDQLNKQYGTTIQNIKDETEVVKGLDIAYQRVIERLVQKQATQQAEKMLEPIIARQIEAQREMNKLITPDQLAFAREQAEATGQSFETLRDQVIRTNNRIQKITTKDPVARFKALGDRVDETTNQIRNTIRQFTFGYGALGDIPVQNTGKSGAIGKAIAAGIYVDPIVYDQEEIKARAHAQIMQNIQKSMTDGLAQINQDYRDTEESRNALSRKLQDEQRQSDLQKELQAIQMRTQILRTGLSLISEIQQLFVKQGEEQSKKQFEFQKKFNIAIALIDTYVAAQSQFKQVSAIPGAGPFAAYAAAAAAIAAGLARVNAIRSQRFNAPNNSVGSSGGRLGATPMGDVGPAPPQTGFTFIQPNVPNQGGRVYVLEKDIRTALLNNQNTRVRAQVK